MAYADIRRTSQRDRNRDRQTDKQTDRQTETESDTCPGGPFEGSISYWMTSFHKTGFNIRISNILLKRGMTTLWFMLFLPTGLATSNGAIYSKMRKLSMASMREFGVGKKSLEEKILEEVCLQKPELEEMQIPCEPHELLMKGTMNIICSIMFGNR